ncbi:insensible [Musca autumnalis]|uniref:insensible n=1 Tax=Musca autumnalis TaxID=221902 RepID=UPI003CE86149
MSGKLIMKRKLDKQQTPPAESQKAIELPSRGTNDASGSKRRQSSTSPNPMEGNIANHNRNELELSSSMHQSKRIRCDTPPPEPEDEVDNLHHPTNQDFLNNERNRQLLEAIQSKMMELQRELDEFEEDFDNYDNEEDEGQQHVMSDQEAEALGYAMCAQETILFLQREGIPSDSLLYTRLHEALVGRGQNDRAFQT